MKKLLFAALAALCLTSCKQSATNTENTEDAEEQTNAVLVAYFSASGNTQAVAELLAEATDADIFEIQPEEPYTELDLDWRDSLSRSSVEMKNPESRPAIVSIPADLDQYDVIFIGFPIWWGVAPHVINTLLESDDYEGKTIIPFVTSGSSAVEPAVENLRATYPDLTILDGRRLNDATFEDLIEWWDALNQ